MPEPPKLSPLPEGLEEYMDVHVVRAEFGHIIWRKGTGGNAEILYIKATKKGGGRRLLRLMLSGLVDNPPYNGDGTVYGFTREGNLTALAFYDKMGFELSRVAGVYAEGSAVCFSAPYLALVKTHLEDV